MGVMSISYIAPALGKSVTRLPIKRVGYNHTLYIRKLKRSCSTCARTAPFEYLNLDTTKIQIYLCCCSIYCSLCVIWKCISCVTIACIEIIKFKYKGNIYTHPSPPLIALTHIPTTPDFDPTPTWKGPAVTTYKSLYMAYLLIRYSYILTLFSEARHKGRGQLLKHSENVN